MKICIISGDIGGNGFWRVWILAKALGLRHQVNIVGTDWGRGFWPGVELKGLEIRTVKGCWWPRYFSVMKETASLVEGDIIYAVKPTMSSYGVGLLSRRKLKKPLILDIDDQESAFTETIWNCWKPNSLKGPNSYLTTRLMEAWANKADARTMVSEYFRKKYYGGVIVPHGRDTNKLNPSLFDSSAEKRARGYEGLELIIFAGTPRRHKGIEDILKAIKITGRRNLKLLIVGINVNDSYSKELMELGEEALLTVPIQPFQDIPKLLSMADLMVLPTIPSRRSVGQVPAKLIDAMAMGKPIITTKMEVIEQTIGDCALLTPPGDVEKLAEGIVNLLTDKDLARELGEKARDKCVKEYSLRVMSDRLEEVLNSIMS